MNTCTFELVIILKGFLHRKLHGHDTNSVRLIFWWLTIILIHVGDRHLHSKYLKILTYSAIVTGPALLIGGFLAYALSKEILVIHDEVLLLLKCRPQCGFWFSFNYCTIQQRFVLQWNHWDEKKFFLNRGVP